MATLLAFTYLAERPAPANEQLHVDDAGVLWLERLVPIAEESLDQVGAFRVTLDPDEQAAVGDLAARLAAVPPRTADPVPGAIRTVVTAAAGEASSRHDLTVVRLEDLEETHRDAVALGRRLRDRALEGPLAALTLALRGRDVPSLRLLLHNPGTQPVPVALEPSSVVILEDAERQWLHRWQAGPDDLSGVVDAATGRLLGLADEPLILDPGASGLLGLPGRAGLSPGGHVIRVRLSGRLGLPGPDDETGAQIPTSAFLLHTPPTRVTVAPA